MNTLNSLSKQSGAKQSSFESFWRGARECISPKAHQVNFRSNFSPFREIGCTARIRVSDTRCGTCVILPAFLQSRCSAS